MTEEKLNGFVTRLYSYGLNVPLQEQRKEIIMDPLYRRHLWKINTGQGSMTIPLTEGEEIALLLGDKK